MTQLNIPTISTQDNRLQWGGLIGCSRGLSISQIYEQNKQPILVITANIHQAELLAQEIKFFSGCAASVNLFPDWETLPYDHFSPHQDIVSERLALLAKLPSQTSGIILANAATLMPRLLPQSYLSANSLLVKIGDKLNLENMRLNLVNNSYRNVGQVMEHGEFSVRGSIIDLFPMGSLKPFRIEFFDDEIETIRSFDPDSQRTLQKIDKIDLLPAREFPLNEKAIEDFRGAWRTRFSGNPIDAPLYQQISNAEAATGIEYYLPLFYKTTSSFFDYLPQNTLIILAEDIKASIDQYWLEITHRHEQLKYDITRPLCEPNEIFLTPDELFSELKPHPQIKFSQSKKSHYQFNISLAPDLTINHRHKEPLQKLSQYMEEYKRNPKARLLFCAESTGRRETLIELLDSINIKPKTFEHWSAFLKEDADIGIITAAIDHGVEINEINVSIITESQLFGEQVKTRKTYKQKTLDPNLMIRNLTELSIGAPIVHINHGVGRYIGLQTINTGGVEGEYLTLEYADHDKIYVPVSSLQLVSRYTGTGAEHAPLQKLGSKQWDKIKRKTAEQIRDVAAELLDIYGRRLAATGFTFKTNKKELQLFTDAFPFEETPDQQSAINAVINDMGSNRSMDRLVCGDVGFGKTEVAMRAAFVAACNNKQVAVLVPTTLLANQHLQNFKDRFSEWPIKVAGLSRMQSQKDQTQTLQELSAGIVDIVIGTHKLLSNTIKFKDLGLLIIDEEQRFGVRQKERITALRAHIDILTLTATPIPRTLNMALAGTRDLSIIATPPLRRLAIKTFVHQEDKSLIREAVLREAMRGGQVYFLHNEVSTIEAQREKLQKIIPEARIRTAHGQMRERELEQVMSDFYHQRFNVLVCSTIIESGIDIPSANTIIINRANRFGLSQLHQLRGRVGRSHHQAYAYLLIPNPKTMTRDAQKRMDAISQLGDLGIGFSLATHDLEIRGAGELLGEEQSGQMHAIGFSLYMELLEEAVSALKAGREPEFEKPLGADIEILLNIPALLPKDYVGDVHVRLTLYKRLAICKNHEETQELKSELIDRFGLLPDSAQNLFSITKIKFIAKQLGIIKIEVSSKYGYLYFNDKPNINPEKIILLIQKQPKVYQLQGMQRLRFSAIAKSADDRLVEVMSLLNIIRLA